MPGSLNDFDPIVSKHLEALNPSSFLDVGCGAGDYGRLVRAVAPALSCLHGIEPTQSYIDTYKLHDTYDHIYNCTVQDFLKEDITEVYDIAYCSDMLEHMFLSEAIDTIDSLLYCSRWVIIKWPTGLNQGWHEGNYYEKHKCNLTLNDLQRFNIHYYSKLRMCRVSDYHYCVISGMHAYEPSLPL